MITKHDVDDLLGFNKSPNTMSTGSLLFFLLLARSFLFHLNFQWNKKLRYPRQQQLGNQ
jgi:hypothetical protein